MRRRPAHRPWRGSQAAATSPSTAITPSTATSPSTATAAASPAGESRLAADGPARPGPSLVQHSGPGPRLGPLAALLRDPEVTDILVNGPDSVWVERAGRLRPTGVRFADDAAVRGLAVRLAASSGRRLDTAMPFADIRLRDGIRLHAMLSPPALGGTCLSLRRPRAVPFTLDDLAAAGTVGPRAATVLRAVLTARLTALISGGTGTGKSTLLAALLDAVPATERVVLVEDTAELVLSRTNVVRLEARPANIEGAGEITQRELVRQALRMRPDRLIVGEVRGPEVLDLLMAMNTGHEGGLGTVHANTAETLPARLEALGALAGLGRSALHSHVAAAVQVAIHLRRDGNGARRVASIGVFRQGADGLVQVVPAVITGGAAAPARRGGGRPGTPPTPEGLPTLLELLDDRGVRLRSVPTAAPTSPAQSPPSIAPAVPPAPPAPPAPPVPAEPPVPPEPPRSTAAARSAATRRGAR